MHRYILLLCFICSALCFFAQNATNVRVRQEGKNIVITYDLKKNSVVRLFMASGNSTQFMELKATSGDIGKGVASGKDRQVVWKPLEEYDKFFAQNVRFKVEAQSSYDYYAEPISPVKTLVSGQIGYSSAPQLSYGAMLGQMYVIGMGWYINGRSTFHFNAQTDLSCDENGRVNGEIPFYSGNKSVSHLVVNIGFIYDFLELWISDNRFNTFGMYIGGGYGMRDVQYETTDGIWIKYSPTSYNGFSGNIGLFGSIYGVTLNVGLNTIQFKYLELEAGIGFMF